MDNERTQALIAPEKNITDRSDSSEAQSNDEKVTKPVNWLFVTVIASIAVAAILLILFAWRLPPFSSPIQETENAYVRGDVISISPQVSGYVTSVLIHDFDYVQAGQELFHIDDRIYRQQVEESKATLASRQSDLAASAQNEASKRATLAARDADIDSSMARAVRAQADLNRLSTLVRDGAVSVQERDEARSTWLEAKAAVSQAKANREVAKQDLESVSVGRLGLVAAVEGAVAKLKQAEVDLSNTVIRAPEDGQVSQVGTRRGQSVAAGTQLVSLVPPRLWVIANYKERQSGLMIPGQPATVSVDALADLVFTGRVEQVSPATGSEFSIMPAQNATGNFTKVAQRLPVRIVLDQGQEGLARLRPGMSVVAYVNTSKHGEQ